MNRKGVLKALPVLVVLTIISAGIILLNWYQQNKEAVIISHDSGIYTESFQLSVNTLQPATIYYTLDGSVPDGAGENTYIYEEPINIMVQDVTDTYSVLLQCVFESGYISPVYCREFIMEPSGMTRFTTQYIVSVTGDEDALLGYEEGIFVRGRKFDEFLAANPDVDVTTEIIPANYYSDTEVPVHVTIFTKEGQEIISKNCGLKIYGNVTRAKNQKSFRLYARDIYDGVNEFEYPFIMEHISDKTGQVIDEYQRISFHNSGNDNGYGFVRTALIGKLASEAGFPDVLHSESAVVYVNGTYQGLYWLQNTYDDKYFKEKYGDYTGEMVVCEGRLNEMTSAKEDTSSNNRCIEEYNAFCQWVESADLSLDENWAVVERTMDVSNFIKYIAIEYYVGNMDWPGNNVKVYRYVSEEDYEEESVFDGRYRYLLFDTDYGFGLKFQSRFGLDATSWRLRALCDLEGNNNLFACLMQRKEFRDEFINTVLVLAQNVFRADNVGEVLSGFCLQKDDELQYAYSQTDLYKNSIWESDDRNFAHVAKNHEYIMEYAEVRPDVVYEELQVVLGTGEIFDLYLDMEAEGQFLVDGMAAGGQYHGYCYENVPMTITCSLPAGMDVSGYYVNGHYVEGEVLELEPSKFVGTEGVLRISTIIEETPQEQLSIWAYDIDGREDYIVLVNSGNVPLNLANYAISDSLETSKGRLPELLLNPGERFYVYGKHYSGKLAEKSIQVSFSWNDEELVILSNINEGIIEQR